MKKLLFLFFIAAFLNFNSAASLLYVNCEDYGIAEEDCFTIRTDANLTKDDKKDLIADLIVGSGKIPNHDVVYDWDKDFYASAAPTGTTNKDNGIIRDAWVKVRGVYPSVYSESDAKWKLSANEKIITDYDYDIQLPSGTKAGDCLTVYANTTPIENLDVFDNGRGIGSEKEIEFTSREGANSIEAVLNVSTNLITTHYRVKQVCTVENEVLVCTEKCVLDSSETTKNSAKVSDSLSAVRNDYVYSVKLTYQKSAGLDIVRIELKINQPINEFIIDFNGGRKFSLSEFDYTTVRDYSPYDSLAIYGKRDFTKTKEGLVEIDFEKTKFLDDFIYEIKLGIDEIPKQCKMKIYTDFGVINLDEQCKLEELKNTILSISTDKEDYSFEEVIKIVTELNNSAGALANKRLVIDYGPNSETVFTGLDGRAEIAIEAGDTFGVINARFEGDNTYAPSSKTARIIVREKADWDLAVVVFGIFAISYIFYLLLKKYTKADI